jgi:molybdenum-dependent DNA-binding transcriptional regulator ModE
VPRRPTPARKFNMNYRLTWKIIKSMEKNYEKFLKLTALQNIR